MSEPDQETTAPALPDRYWLLTWTTYGTWLPGDRRRFVSTVKDGPGPQVRHNKPGTAYDSNQPGLQRSAASLMKSAPIRLTSTQAIAVSQQIAETCAWRGWTLLAVAVMANHAHAVIGVPGDPEPSTILRDLKSYASRRLNAEHSKPANGTWWTQSGSKRKLPDGAAVVAAIHYIRQQQHALSVWTHDDA
ncbi:MAG: transposase [Planctomycetaceae bacterium]